MLGMADMVSGELQPRQLLSSVLLPAPVILQEGLLVPHRPEVLVPAREQPVALGEQDAASTSFIT